MRFDCGETWEAKLARLQEWHDFYPLWPRTISTSGGRKTCAWLETIQRRRSLDTDVAPWFEWVYREKP